MPRFALASMLAITWGIVGSACSGDAGGNAAEAGPVAEVRFTPAASGFAEPFMLELAARDAGAEVRYTLDGTLPTAGSPLYTNALAIAQTTLVRAVAVRDGVSGAVVQHVYLELDEETQTFGSELPVIVVHMQGRSAPDPSSREFVPALIASFEPRAGETRLLGPSAHASRAGIKRRGRSTRNDDKGSYTFELWGALDEDAQLPLLGMPADGDFVLYAPYRNDRSLVRNALAYALSNAIGEYAPRTRFCELFFATDAGPLTEAAYAGVYLLVERIERSDDRVDVARLAPEDAAEPEVSGGYVFQKDDSDQPDDAFNAAGEEYLWVEPHAEDVTPAQRDYLTGYLDGVERALDTDDGRDPESGTHYTELVDSAAFIDHHILNVLAKNPDGAAYSAYFHKDREGKLRAGPLWDFDLSMGANDPFGDRSRDPRSWGPSPDDTFFDRLFYRGLFRHQEFEDAYWERWDELLAGPFRSGQLRDRIDSLATEVRAAELRNRERWPDAAPRNDSYEEEIAALQEWLEARVAFIADNAGTLP